MFAVIIKFEDPSPSRDLLCCSDRSEQDYAAADI